MVTGRENIFTGGPCSLPSRPGLNAADTILSMVPHGDIEIPGPVLSKLCLHFSVQKGCIYHNKNVPILTIIKCGYNVGTNVGTKKSLYFNGFRVKKYIVPTNSHTICFLIWGGIYVFRTYIYPPYGIYKILWACGYKAQKNAVSLEIQRFGLYPHLYSQRFSLWVQTQNYTVSEPSPGSAGVHSSP